MKIRQLAVLLFFALSASVGYGAATSGAMLDDLSGNNLVYGTAHNALPGGNAILDASGTVPNAVVPEPSTVALLGLGLLGCAALARRRRTRLEP